MTLIVLRSVWAYVWAARLLNRLAHMKMMSLSGLIHSLEKHEQAKTNREKVKVIGTSFEYIYSSNVIPMLGDTDMHILTAICKDGPIISPFLS